jgi:hypothetical protein
MVSKGFNPKNAIEYISPSFAGGFFIVCRFTCPVTWRDRPLLKAPDKSGNYEALGNNNAFFGLNCGVPFDYAQDKLISEFLNPKLETRNPKPETRNSEAV